MAQMQNHHLESDELTDRCLIEHMRRVGRCTIHDLVKFAGVTATAIRQRVNRLMEQGLVVRQAERAGRGRPTHWYSLTPAGQRAGGDNYHDLATVLWSEIRAIEDPAIKRGLLQRIVSRLTGLYQSNVEGETVAERMGAIVGLMKERDIHFEVQDTANDKLPILKAMACPYPELAEQDRMVCSMEKMLFSEVLGTGLKLDTCRLDGDSCCNFTVSNANSSVSQP